MSFGQCSYDFRLPNGVRVYLSHLSVGRDMDRAGGGEVGIEIKKVPP